MTQQDLADLLQLARNTVAMYESGDREPCHTVTQRLAEILGTTTDFLLGCCDDWSPTSVKRHSTCDVTCAILEHLRGLPQAELQEVLSFVQFKRQRLSK